MGQYASEGRCQICFVVVVIQCLNYGCFCKEEKSEGEGKGEDRGSDCLRNLKVENSEQL